MSVTVTVKLETPISFNGETFTELTFRKMKVKDLVAGDLIEGETAKSLAIYGSMAAVAAEVIAELEVDDFEALGDKVAPLMGKSAQAAVLEAARKRATKTGSQAAA